MVERRNVFWLSQIYMYVYMVYCKVCSFDYCMRSVYVTRTYLVCTAKSSEGTRIISNTYM